MITTTPYILLVEDDESHAQLIQRSFTKHQLSPTIVQVTTIADALKKIKETIPDIVITDLRLPDGNGISLIPEAATHHFPLIVMTSQGNEQAAVETLKAGALDYIVKSNDTFLDMPHIVSRALREWNHINEKKQAAEEIKRREANIAATLYSIGEGVVATNTDGNIIRMNPMAEKITDTPFADAHNKQLYDIFKLINANSRKPIDDPVKTVLHRGHSIRFAYHTLLISQNGTERRVAISGTPIRNSDNTISGIVLVFRDITEQYNLEDQLRQAQKMKAIGQLAGGIAHDFNNLLTGIINFTELLKQQVGESIKCRKYLDGILNATNRASDLTSKLLTFARKGTAQVESLDIHAMIDDVVGILNHTIDRNITIKQSYHASISHIMGTPSQLQNAILNIALNARDAMPHGGELIFMTKNVTLDKVFCKQVAFDIQPGEYIELSITDTGIGMDERTKKHLFEPFFTTKDVGKGTGLGLATVYGTIKNHNGAVSVYSEENIGSTFRLYLPITTNIKPYFSSDTLKEPVSGSGHVLLVDDEESIRLFGEEILEQLGYTTTVCEDGEEAIEYFKNNYHAIDIVLLDLVMPKMDGKAILEQLKAIDQNVKVIITTGYSAIANADELYHAGAQRIIQKPYNLIELSHTLVEVMT